jgi:hypothetical protein
LSEEHNEAGKLDEAEEVVGVIFPADEDSTLPLYPGEKALDQLTASSAIMAWCATMASATGTSCGTASTARGSTTRAMAGSAIAIWAS